MRSIGINPKTSSEYNVIIADPSAIERKLLARFLLLNSFKIANEIDNAKSILENMKSLNPSPDIIFLETTMLGKEGSQFLRMLNSDFPNLRVIFIISSKVQEAYMLKNRINYYIMKPFLKKNIEEKLSEILSDKAIEISSKQNEEKIKLKNVYIPPIPNAVHKILLFETNTSGGSQELENILLPDKSLCADLLRVANSSLYGRAGSIKTLQDAITLLGIKTIKNIVIVQSRRHMSENLDKIPIFKKFLCEFPTLSSLISHDLISLLGKAKDYKEIFLLSSFRKIGMNILALNFKDQYQNILKSSENGNLSLVTLENTEISLNHIQVGVSVMNEWKMPSIFTETVQNQDFPLTSFRSVNEIDRITRIAEVLAKKLLNLNPSTEEDSIIEEANSYYKPKKDFSILFDSEYHSNIISHPFFNF